MALWLIRAGENGRYEEKFLRDGRAYMTLPGLSVNMAILPDRDGLAKAVSRTYPAAGPQRVSSLVHQLWPFAHEAAKGDTVLLLLARQSALRAGEITGDYRFEHAAADPFYHWRPVAWHDEPVPRSYFASDLLLSLSTRLDFCRLRRNSAEQRLAAMRDGGWKPEQGPVYDDGSDEIIEGLDLEAAARDRIDRHISASFTGEGLKDLVVSVLRARGYTPFSNLDGMDDSCIAAGAGPLGMGQPRVCVRVLMTAEPVGRPELDDLLAAAEKMGAQETLFVSWGGFTDTARRQPASDFSRLRLWSAGELIDELLSCYGRLDGSTKALLGLRPLLIPAAQG